MILHFKEFWNLIGYLNMPDHAHIDICLHAENQRYHPLPSQNITL